MRRGLRGCRDVGYRGKQSPTPGIFLHFIMKPMSVSCPFSSSLYNAGKCFLFFFKPFAMCDLAGVHMSMPVLVLTDETRYPGKKASDGTRYANKGIKCRQTSDGNVQISSICVNCHATDLGKGGVATHRRWVRSDTSVHFWTNVLSSRRERNNQRKSTVS